MSIENGQPQAPNTFTFPWRNGLIATFGAFFVALIALTLVGGLSTTAEELVYSLPLFSGIDPMIFGAAFEFFSYCTIFGVTIAVLSLFVRGRYSFTEITRSSFALLRARFGQALGWGFLGYALSVAAIIATYSLLPLPEPHSPAGEFAKTLDGFAFVFFALSAVVAAPILEELLFRGLMQNMLRGSLRAGFIGRYSARFADVIAVLVTGAIFALMHGTLTGFPPLFITGVLLGAVYVRTNNLWAAVAMHAFNNLVATLLLWASISISI